MTTEEKAKGDQNIEEAVLKEREACAKLIEDYFHSVMIMRGLGENLTKVIRARSTPKSSNPPPVNEK